MKTLPIIAIVGIALSVGNSPTASPSSNKIASAQASGARQFSFEERVVYQRAIEEVYWRHRIWPNENGRAKPSLDKVMPQVAIEKKVKDYLHNSQLLEQYWQESITPEQLQAEVDRFARNSKQPDVLREIFAALADDPAVIAECLARPVLAERLLRHLYARDQRFHGELKRRAEGELASHHTLAQMKETSGKYTELELVKSTGGDPRSVDGNAQQAGAIGLSESEWNENLATLAQIFRTPTEAIPAGNLSSLQEDDVSYYATAVLSKNKDRLKIARMVWTKLPLDQWRAKAALRFSVPVALTVRGSYKLPNIATTTQSCAPDNWTETYVGTTAMRNSHTAVWTGSEMIVWGGYDNAHTNSALATGARYNPSTDS